MTTILHLDPNSVLSDETFDTDSSNGSRDRHTHVVPTEDLEGSDTHDESTDGPVGKSFSIYLCQFQFTRGRHSPGALGRNFLKDQITGTYWQVPLFP